MRKLAAFVLVLVVLVSTLNGCGNSLLSPQTVQCDDLTITMPGYFLDKSDRDFARGLPFVYGFQDAAVMGLKEPRAVLDGYLEENSAAAYAELFLQVNRLDVPVTEEDGLTLFRYSVEAEGTQISYLCAAYMGKTNYWIIQTYCATGDLKDFEADFMEILRSVQV